MTNQLPAPCDVVLRDGSTLRVRATEPGDAAGLGDFLRALSPQSRALRFCGGVSDAALPREASRLVAASGEVVGLVATAGSAGRIVGHAMFAELGHASAEVALVVSDEYQGQGLGTILLGQLAQIAAARGVTTFTADVLASNRPMLGVFQESGFPVTVTSEHSDARVEFPTEVTGETLRRFDEREWTATVNAMNTFFHPRSVAVIGASRRRGSIGGTVLHNLLGYEFAGPVFPVNPEAAVVQSVLAYPGVGDVPGPVDLAVIAVPADAVLRAAEECGKKGVRALVVLSAGFAETGAEGRERQDGLVRICRAYGMRLMGPNCMGIVNSAPQVRLNATFAPTPPARGRIAFMSQSGALGLAIMDYANALGLGLSTFASVGNKADISGNDLIRFWSQDADTDVILLYLESFGNPRKFSRIARRVARDKPIVAVKSGRSLAGARAAGSHTGALIAASEVTVDALFRHSGVIRTDTLREMFDVASLLVSQPAPRGRRVAIVTNAGGPAILCADACEGEGLLIPRLADATVQALAAILPAEGTAANPVDLIAAATPDLYLRAVETVGRDPGVDAVIVILVPSHSAPAEETARAVAEAARRLGGAVPVLAVLMRSAPPPVLAGDARERVPFYAHPEDAARALANVARYGEWRARPDAAPTRLEGVRRDEALAIVTGAVGRGAGWLSPDEAGRLLRCYGLMPVEERIVATADEAAAAAVELGGEVALKAVAPGLLHRTEAGAVRAGLAPARVREEALAMEARLRAAGTPPAGFLVQRMAPKGAEMIVGVVHDPEFGPVVACGAGGVVVELLRDVSVRLTPLARADAEEMVRELKTYPLLTGYRGAPVCDVDALVDAVVRVGALVEDLPQVAELDLNPIIVHPGGAAVVDARIRVAPPPPSPLLGQR